MFPIYEYPILAISGSLDKDHYGTRNPYNPDRPIIKHKPRHKAGWVKPASMIRQNSTYQQAIQAAKRDYHDPVARAAWQIEYDSWLSNRKRLAYTIPRPDEPSIRFLWDYIRWQHTIRAYNQPATPIGT